jgi:hypothetical protein
LINFTIFLFCNLLWLLNNIIRYNYKMSNNKSSVNFTDPSLVTGLTSAAGDLILGNTSGLTNLPVGSNGQVLTVSGGLPSWDTPGGSSAVLNQLGGGAAIKGAGDLDVRSIVAGSGLDSSTSGTEITLSTSQIVDAGQSNTFTASSSSGFTSIGNIDIRWMRVGNVVTFVGRVNVFYNAGSIISLTFRTSDAGMPGPSSNIGYGSWAVGAPGNQATFGYILVNPGFPPPLGFIELVSSTPAVLNTGAAPQIRFTGTYGILNL